jgi:putative sigma-54 modulation protein
MMKIVMIGRKVTLHDNFKELVRKKLLRFDRLFEDDAEAKVVVTVEKNRQTVEITIRSRGMIYRAESTADAMNTALDDVIDALSSQIRKNKKYLSKELRRAGFDELQASNKEKSDAEGEGTYDVVRTKHFVVKPMSVDEAILQMEMIEHQFFMFRNEKNGEINVVYRRKGGGFGLLEPEE